MIAVLVFILFYGAPRLTQEAFTARPTAHARSLYGTHHGSRKKPLRHAPRLTQEAFTARTTAHARSLDGTSHGSRNKP